MNRSHLLTFTGSKGGALLILLLCPLLLLAQDRSPAEYQVVIVKPGGQGNTASARGAMKQFSQSLEKITGKPVSAVYFNQTSKVDQALSAHLKKGPIHMAIVSLPFYLKYRDQYNFQLQGQAKRQGETSNQYYWLVAADSKAKDLAELAGQKISGDCLYEPEFASLLFFGKKKHLAEKYKIKATSRAFRAIRNLSRGKRKGVIVDRFQWKFLNHPRLKRYRKKVRVLAVTKEFPTVPVVSFGPPPVPLKKAFFAMSKNEKGQKVLKLFGLEDFVSPRKKDFQAWLVRWTKKSEQKVEKKTDSSQK